jgi:hypothetical protein
MTLPTSIKLKPGPKKSKGGRPSSTDSLHDMIRTDSELKGILVSESKGEERFNDTIKRLLIEKINRIVQLHKEVDRLEGQLKQLGLTGVFV